MKSLAEQMSVYHRYHKKFITKLTHFVGVPLAIFPVLILLNWVQIGIPNWFLLGSSWLVILGLFVYYLLLDWELGIATTVILVVINIAALLIAGNSPSWYGLKVAVIVFVLAWAIQFLGHFFEGKRPALMDNFFQVLIAPIFLVAEAAFMMGKRTVLRDEVIQLANQKDLEA